MARSEMVRDILVLLAQEAARCVEEPPAWLDQATRRAQDRALLRGELRDGLGSVAPLEVRVAPQGSETTTRRVHQHAVEHASEAFGA